MNTPHITHKLKQIREVTDMTADERVVRGRDDLRDERDECRQENRQACIALADGFVPQAERAGAHLQGLPRLVAHAVEHHQWHHDAHNSDYVRKLETERDDWRARVAELEAELRKLIREVAASETEILEGTQSGHSGHDEEPK